jgi:hypothetical protein
LAVRTSAVRDHYIIDSAAALLGISLLIVTAVHISGNGPKSMADELSYGAALLFLTACAFSHRGIVTGKDHLERVGDVFFSLGLLALLAGVLTFWF